MLTMSSIHTGAKVRENDARYMLAKLIAVYSWLVQVKRFLQMHTQPHFVQTAGIVSKSRLLRGLLRWVANGVRPMERNSLTADTHMNRQSGSTVARVNEETWAKADCGASIMDEKTMKKAKVDLAAFSLVNHPFFLINHIFLSRGRELGRELALYDLDYPRWRVLSVLNECPNCTMQTLAEAAGVDRTSLTHTVRLMIDAGLISKTTRQSDRRSVVLSLTGAGRDRLRTVLPIIVGNSEKCFAGFSDEETKLFMNYLRRIILNIRNSSQNPAEDDAAVGYKLLESIVSSET
ncbi:MarR family transcriptional regulator (plasmid) [Agrobacterium tumefaciens]|uniref:MarR family transcriptional regulator n=1 Tax=Agrobacterium tumefaciens TaxID=358 RepID=A0AAJ4N8T9_AGRTU|nr:MarR family transcriptional regulator [Agrobacterium tumefaciens]